MPAGPLRVRGPRLTLRLAVLLGGVAVSGCAARVVAPAVSGDEWIEPATSAPAAATATPAALPATSPVARALATPAPRRHEGVRIAIAGPRTRPARFVGRPIDIDVVDVDLHNLFRFVADYAGVNIVVADGVTGTITMKLAGVPWDEVLWAVARVKGLSIERAGRIWYVMPSRS